MGEDSTYLKMDHPLPKNYLWQQWHTEEHNQNVIAPVVHSFEKAAKLDV